MPNYSYVIDSSFQPFSMQEMLVPFTAYKDAYEKSEEAYNNLSEKADTFKYLSETLPEGSKARQLYEGYAHDLQKQAEDLSHNGLTMTNKRALTSLRRRYQGEIGRLLKANEAMDAENKLRRSLNAQDSSRLYATDNLSIDDFLDGDNPNLYNISGNELYTRGAAAGKAASARVFSFGDRGSTLGGYYRDLVSTYGYDPERINKFRQDVSSIPELQASVDAILAERGVLQNLKGINLQRARQSVINGMIDGAIYQEQHSPQRDLGVLDAATQAQLAQQGLTYDSATGTMTYDMNNDASLKRQMAIASIKTQGRAGGNGSHIGSMLPKPLKIEWNGDVTEYDSYGNKLNQPEVRDGREDDITTTWAKMQDGDEVGGASTLYDDLPDFVKKKVIDAVGNSNVNNYHYYYQPYKYGVFNDTEASVTIVPGDLKKEDVDPGMDWGSN